MNRRRFPNETESFYFPALFAFAHLFRCAAAILARPSGLMVPFLRRPRLLLLVPASKARAWVSFLISASIRASISFVMEISVSHTVL